MKIKTGFNDKETSIKIGTQSNGSIELWIKETGKQDSQETLSYLTADELIKLYKEVKQACKDLFD